MGAMLRNSPVKSALDKMGGMENLERMMNDPSAMARVREMIIGFELNTLISVSYIYTKAFCFLQSSPKSIHQFSHIQTHKFSFCVCAIQTTATIPALFFVSL